MAVTDTAVCAWGSNRCGQLGTRTFMDKASPTEIKELEGAGVDHVACGAQHTLFLCRYAASFCIYLTLSCSSVTYMCSAMQRLIALPRELALSCSVTLPS